MYNFNSCETSNRHYGGNAGAKLGIVFQGDNWILKFPQSTRGNRTQEISYTTNSLSEYLGSKIYESLDIPVHETLLGVYAGKIVVACKDFIKDGESLLEFNKIKNTFFPGMDELLPNASSSGASTDIDEIKIVMDHNSVFQENPLARERFWDMFVVDALIGNQDRNNGNWGFIQHEDHSLTLAPVYDNGNSFANKAGDEKMQRMVDNQEILKHSALNTCVCVFSKDDKPINPYKYIKGKEDPELQDAILRIVPRIDLNRIDSIIDDIPEEFAGINVISEVRRTYYKELISVRYHDVLLPVFQECSILNRGKQGSVNMDSAVDRMLRKNAEKRNHVKGLNIKDFGTEL